MAKKVSSTSRISRVRAEIVDLCQKHKLALRLDDAVAEFTRSDGFLCRTTLEDQDEALKRLVQALRARGLEP